MSRHAGSASLVLNDAADIRRGVIALRRRCAVIRAIHDQTGDPPVRRQKPGFEGLARIIVAQQVSAASAAAIWSRTERVLNTVTPARLLKADGETLRACGLSRPKMRTLRALAEAVATRTLDLKHLDDAPEDEIHDALTRIHGIGPWTADVYLMFSLGRADAWASGDLVLQLALARALRLEEKPSAPQTLALSERWRPWRAVAARLLWSFHATPARQPSPARPAAKKARVRAT